MCHPTPRRTTAHRPGPCGDGACRRFCRTRCPLDRCRVPALGSCAEPDGSPARARSNTRLGMQVSVAARRSADRHDARGPATAYASDVRRHRSMPACARGLLDVLSWRHAGRRSSSRSIRRAVSQHLSSARARHTTVRHWPPASARPPRPMARRDPQPHH